MGETVNGVTSVRDSNGTEWCLTSRLYNNAVLTERDRKKLSAPEWIPYGSIGVIVDARPQGIRTGAEVWLKCDWQEYGFMLDEEDPRRVQVVSALVKHVADAIIAGSLSPDSVWLLDLVQHSDGPKLVLSRTVR